MQTKDVPAVTRTMRHGGEPRVQQGGLDWPNGVRAAVALAIDFDGPSHDVGQGFPPLGARSTGRYAGKRGVRRHLDLLAKHDIPATFFVPGYDAECYPALIGEIAAEGHEVGAHGYLHEREILPAEEERRRLSLTHEILRELTGAAPQGWRSPSGQKTRTTLETLHELGYLYDTSDKDFDVPYLLDLGQGRELIEIPNNTFSLDDHPFFNFSMTPAAQVLDLWKDEFSATLQDRGFYLLSIHPRSGWGSGTPARSRMLSELIAFIKHHEGVGFFTLSEIARCVERQRDNLEVVRA